MKQLDQERASQSEAMQVLQAEVEGGSTRVTQLEHALEACRHELEDHVTRVEEAAQVHRNEVEVLKKQVRRECICHYCSTAFVWGRRASEIRGLLCGAGGPQRLEDC